MSESTTPRVGAILWSDLTVERAEETRDFYREVVGWSAEGVDMGGYEDFNMYPVLAGDPVAGICHARGSNEGLPAQWLIYISVASVDDGAARCVELGGRVIVDPKNMGDQGRYCVIQDPAGAVAALFESTSK